MRRRIVFGWGDGMPADRQRAAISVATFCTEGRWRVR